MYMYMYILVDVNVIIALTVDPDFCAQPFVNLLIV